VLLTLAANAIKLQAVGPRHLYSSFQLEIHPESPLKSDFQAWKNTVAVGNGRLLPKCTQMIKRTKKINLGVNVRH